MLSRCFLDFSVGVGTFVLGLSPIFFFFSCHNGIIVEFLVFSDIRQAQNDDLKQRKTRLQGMCILVKYDIKILITFNWRPCWSAIKTNAAL